MAKLLKDKQLGRRPRNPKPVTHNFLYSILISYNLNT